MAKVAYDLPTFECLYIFERDLHLYSFFSSSSNRSLLFSCFRWLLRLYEFGSKYERDLPPRSLRRVCSVRGVRLLVGAVQCTHAVRRLCAVNATESVRVAPRDGGVPWAEQRAPGANGAILLEQQREHVAAAVEAHLVRARAGARVTGGLG